MTIWPLVVYFAAVILIVATMLSLSYVLGQRHKEPATGSPFESGIVSEGSVHVRFSVKFYLVAMFFVVFDLEAVFIFLWAVVGRELGWAGYREVLIFHRGPHGNARICLAHRSARLVPGGTSRRRKGLRCHLRFVQRNSLV